MFHANGLATWAFLLCARGDAEHALAVVDETRRIAAPDDVGDQATLDFAEAYARALTGEHDRARPLLQRAGERTQGIDLEHPLFNNAYREASVLTALDDLDGARRLLEGLIERHAARGFHRYAARYRRDLDALG